MRNKDYYKAYRYWYKKYKSQKLDDAVRPFLQIPSKHCNAQGRCWISESREALLISVQDLASRLQVSPTAIRGFEKRELEGTITIEKLKQVAEAMDCELVYAIRPKAKIPFSHVIWKKLLKDSVHHWWVRSRPPERKAQALGWIARLQFNEPEYRKEQGWAQRKLR